MARKRVGAAKCEGEPPSLPTYRLLSFLVLNRTKRRYVRENGSRTKGSREKGREKEGKRLSTLGRTAETAGT